MNLYAAIILGALIAEYLLNLAADLLNLGTLGTPLPEEFKGFYEEPAYQKAQRYSRTRIGFGLVEATAGLIIVLAFWFLGGFGWLDLVVRGWKLGELLTGLLYIGVIVLARGILSLPFSIYSTFVIEERYGFNKTTPRTFILDLLKAFMLGIVIGIPLLAGILALFQRLGPGAWIYCWIVATAVLLFIQFIAPAWIMPIFNKFSPLENGPLRDAILAFASRAKFPLRDIYVMDGSKRSTRSNAFFTGFGKGKRIALYDTLIRKHTGEELVAVLAHEIGHYKRHHIVQGLLLAVAHLGVVFFLLSLFLGQRELFDAFFVERMSVYAGLIFFGMLYTPLEFFLSLLMHAISRHNEYEADRFAALVTGRPADLVGALKKLSVDNLSHLTPHPMAVVLHYSHPTVLDRIRALGQTGDVGSEAGRSTNTAGHA